MKASVATGLILAASCLVWGCSDPVGTSEVAPDMYVRVNDAEIVRDALQLDMAMVFQECEAGETRPCGTDEGLCQQGTELCTEFGLWSGECIGSTEAMEEVCDEQDNDCDGRVDEIFRLGQTCKYTDDRGFERTGRVYCDIEAGVPYCRPEADCSVDEDGDGSGVCDDCDDTDPQNFPGNEERCDDSDNDCDDRIDETFDLDMACQIGEGLCRRGGVTICAMNGTEITCQGEPGEPEDETCDGQDNDCDGNSDEGFDLMAECTVGVGACTRPGVIACDVNGGAECQGDAGDPALESCNEIDDDCDMAVDEGLALGEVCSVGRGICVREGVNRCNPDGSGTVSCSVEAGVPADAEVCDGLDNDCDGVVDEGDPRDENGRGGGDECSTGRPGRCEDGTLRCVGGSVSCQPLAAGVPEVCNGIDDDCNEVVDDVEGRGAACTAGVGECLREGQRECDLDVGDLVCNVTAGEPQEEVCNGLDDNCNGAIDEGDPGGGERCETGELGICLLGETECVAVLNGDGEVVGGRIQCNRTNDPGMEVCNGLDDDCNGPVDDVADRGSACSVGIGACRRDGTLQCFGNQLSCSAQAGPQAPERCDNIDNDCDGPVDEAFSLGQPCTVGQGVCQAPGVTVCAENQLATSCRGEAGLGGIEICDGLDNDCDGTADEGNPESGDQCDTGQPGRCSRGLTNCRNGIPVCDRVDDPIVELCNGINDDCDENTDEDFALNQACLRGVGACEEVGQLVCNEALDGTECSVDGGIAQNELCDGIDNDCDGRTDEGYDLGQICVAGVGRCATNGQIICREDGSAGCDAVPREPLPEELCNRINDELSDDDCDGRIDENNPEGGGVCPVDSPGRCRFGTMTCSEGALSCVPDALPGDLDETCNGIDDDCDGPIDEGNPGGGVVCQTNDLGACRDGTTQCAGGILLCFADLPPGPESCDYIDNDCDGREDEDYPTLGDACDSDDDADLCANGTIDCDPANGGTRCVGDQEIPETCDNRDNDCDGVIDNGFDKLSDVTNCGTCGRDCRDPDPLNPGFEYPNAACVGGACFQTYYVDEANGSNASGDGSQESPWRTMTHALTVDAATGDGLIDASNYAARIYVAPGRYSPDQWTNLAQCDGDQDGNPANDLCGRHTIACETDNNPITVERCSECRCSDDFVCANGLCSLPASEREDFPITMRERIQIVGDGNVDHIVLDGGSRACFVSEANGADGVACNLNTRTDGGKLLQAVNMADQEFQDEGNTCFEIGNPDCMGPDDANYAFLSAQPNWHGRGSRNLLANITFLRGGRGNDSALLVSSSNDYINDGKRTALRVQGVKFQKIRASNAFSVATVYDSNVLFDKIEILDSHGTGARGLILANRSFITVDRSHFQENDITALGLGLLRASNAELNVRNSTCTNNIGGCVLFHTEGRGSVYHSSFAGNSYYNVVVAIDAFKPVVVANNIFSNTRDSASVYVHQQEEGGTSIHNNLFYETVQGFVSGRATLVNTVQLNARSWASDNLSGNPRFSNVNGNDLSLSRANSSAIDEASPLPTPTPPPSALVDMCAADFDCINAGARDPKWNLDAYICEDAQCVVDTEIDDDGDGYPDWLEILFGSDPMDVASWPPEYNIQSDYDGFPRPSGPAKDVGAYEFTQ